MVKTALVTGASGGIGSAVAEILAENGCLTAVGYNHNNLSAEKLCEKICGSGYTAKAFYCDISDMQSMKNCISEVEKEFGNIDILINNAGISDIELFTEMSDEKMLDMINTNLIGAMRLSKLVLPEMIKRHKGNIVNISSVWGEVGASCEVAYSAAKAGLIGFTKALAREVAPSGIRVNCVSCGMIDTKMNGELSEEDVKAIVDEIPLCRIGMPKDIADAVEFLTNEKSSYITGQVLRVDGLWI